MQKDKKINKKYKILFLTAWYPNDSNPLDSIFIREHVEAISLYNDVIVIYGRKVRKDLRKSWEIISDKIENGIRTIRIYLKKTHIQLISDILNIYSFKITVKKLINEGWIPDIIHAHIYSAGVPAVIIGKLYKTPVIITEHYSGFPRHKMKFINILKAKYSMNRAQIILPVSSFLQKAIENYGIRNRFEVVPDTVNTKLFCPLLDTNIDIKKKRILSITSFLPIKGIPYLLEALSIVRNKRCDFICDIIGDGPKRQEYEELVRRLGIYNIVTFHGSKPKEEVAEYMKRCNFYIQTSLLETFGVTFIEAMSCGKPVIATQIPVLIEKINKDRGILVPPKDIKSIANAIDYMLDHYKEYNSEEIYKYAKDNFSHESIGKRFNKIYRDVIKTFSN